MTRHKNSCCTRAFTSPGRAERRTFAFRPLTLAALAFFAVVTFLPAAAQQNTDDYYRGMVRGLELFGEVYREIVERYAGRADPGGLAEQAIRGMIASLDRYSAYVSPATAEHTSRRSLRVGVGIEADTTDGSLTVTEVLEGYSARQAGVRVGDLIMAVNGVPFADSLPEALYGALRGEVGATLQLTLRRGDREMNVTLARERVRIPSLRYGGPVQEGILFLRLERFGENAGNEFRSELLRGLRGDSSSGKIAGIILDLRGNTGGILEEAIRIAECFVPQGELIVAVAGRDTAEREVWFSERDPLAAGIPLAVLVDRHSASASELLAAAIQDHDLGVIVGEPTVGKGMVQSVRTLPFGASVRLTTAWYVTPSGRSIQQLEGLVPAGGTDILPDSLLGSFYTDNGRPVESGAGILPDTSLPELPAEPIIRRLERAGAFFRFATLYAAPLDSLPANFRLGNDALRSFEEYGLGRLLEYEQEEGAVALLDSLQERFAERKNGKRIARLFDELSRAIIAEDEVAFGEGREEIRRRLEREIAGRFRSRELQIAASLPDDPAVRLAVALLQNRAAYKRLLRLP